MAYLQSRSGIARSGVTYCGWAKPNFTFRIAGSVVSGSAVLQEGWRIVKSLDGNTSTMYFSVHGITPTLWNEIKVTYTTPNVYEFAGHIVDIQTSFSNARDPIVYHCTALSYVWLLGLGTSGLEKLVTRQYRQGVNTAVGDILTTFADSGGFRVGYVPSTLGDIWIDFTLETVPNALTRIAKTVGATWEVSDDGVVSMYVTYPETALATIGNSTAISNVTYRQDGTQVRPWAYVRGGGATATANVEVGSTDIPVSTGQPFLYKGSPPDIIEAVIVGQQVLLLDSMVLNETLAAVGVDDFGPATLSVVGTPTSYFIYEGDSIDVLALAFNSAADTAFAAALGSGPEAIGIHLIEDRRLSADAAKARAETDVALLGTAINEFSYTTSAGREARPGRVITVNITTPITISGTFLIQSVEVISLGNSTQTAPHLYRRIKASPFVMALGQYLQQWRLPA